MLHKSQENDKKGRYEWCIDKDLTKNILSAKCGDSSDSKMFTIAQCNWIFRLYPSGWDAHNDGYCGIFVQLTKMPPIWKSVFCQLHIECPQIHTKMIECVCYNEPQSFGFYISSLKQLKQDAPSKLSFILSIHITRIMKQNDHILYQQMSNKTSPYKKNSRVRFEWKLDKAMMKRLKTYERPQGICSDIYDDMWIIKLFPNGGWCSKEGEVEIGLELCSLPQNASTLSVQWKVALKRHKANQTVNSEFSETNSYHYWNKNSVPLLFYKFAKYDTLTVCVNIINIEYHEHKQSNDILPTAFTDHEFDNDLIQAMESSKFEVYDTSMRSMHDQLNSFESRFNRMDSMMEVIESQSDEIKTLTESVSKLSMGYDKLWMHHKETERELLKISDIVSDLQENEENKQEITEELKRQIAGLLNTVGNNKEKPINHEHEAVRQWLKMEANLEIYFDLFIHNGFEDLDTIKTLNIGILKMLPISKIGHQMKILRCVHKLNDCQLNDESHLQYNDEGVAVTAYQ